MSLEEPLFLGNPDGLIHPLIHPSEGPCTLAGPEGQGLKLGQEPLRPAPQAC